MSKKDKLRKWALKCGNIMAAVIAVVGVQAAMYTATVTCAYCFYQPRVPESVKKLKEQQ